VQSGLGQCYRRRHNRRSNCRCDGCRPVQVSLVSCGVNVASVAFILVVTSRKIFNNFGTETDRAKPDRLGPVGKARIRKGYWRLNKSEIRSANLGRNLEGTYYYLF